MHKRILFLVHVLRFQFVFRNLGQATIWVLSVNMISARVTMIIILGLDAAISSKIMKKFAFYSDINKHLLQLSKQDYM